MEHDPHTDSELIDLIYGALLGEVSWQAFLDRMSDNVPDGRALLFSHNMSQSDEYLAMTSRCEGPEIESYASHYVDVNPWLPHCAVRKVGLGIYSDQIIPREELIRTEFFSDWLVPNDIACSIGVTIDKDGACPLIISILTSRGDPEMNGRFSDQLTRIAPHLRRAARYYRNSPARWAGFDAGVGLLDAMDVGAVVVGEDRRIRAASRIGRQWLERGEQMALSPLGQVCLDDDDAQTVLRSMLKRTYAGPKSVSLLREGVKLTLVSIEKDGISLCFEGPTVAVLVERPSVHDHATDLEPIARTYGLSMGERRALRGVLAGKTISEIAEDASVSRETIRSQLKSLYAKTGTGGQTDLLRLVHGYRTRTTGRMIS